MNLDAAALYRAVESRGTPGNLGTGAAVARALRLIDEGGLDGAGIVHPVNSNEDAMSLCLSEHRSPLGDFTLVTRGDALCVAAFSDHAEGLLRALPKRYPDLPLERGAAPRAIAEAFAAYWLGARSALDPLAVEPGGTAFQARIWAQLRAIPVGQTISYAELARRVGSPGASRAAGSANGANPISVVIPCHRVIRGDGDLSGYAGGVPRKRWLLEHEGAMAQPS